VKNIAYILYGIIFHILRLFPVKSKKVVCLMIHNSRFTGNLRYMCEEMEKRDEFTFVVLSKKQLFSVSGTGPVRVLRLMWAAVQFYVVWNYHLATAGYILLNDNFLPLAYMNLSKKTKLVQLWHGVGAWKRFGLTSEEDETVRAIVRKGNQQLTHVFVSSQSVVPCYQDAFGVSKDKIYVTGIPVTDFYFDQEKQEQAKARVYKKYPEIKGKKVILYTPTFRDDKEADRNLFQRFPARELLQELGNDWVILLRLHPQVHQNLKLSEAGCYDATKYADVKDLYVVADVLINDYSSTVVEYALLHKPIYQYAYDLDRFSRGFYWDYVEYAPGPIAYNWKELVDYLKEGTIDEERWNRFVALQYGQPDGQATKRAVDIILEK
jgi:CDP-glycerol glycerophosphotransferase (TagB/SpsB family)